MQKLFEILEVNLSVDRDVKFVRRMHKGEGDTSLGPRPLVVHMRKKADRDLVLANTYKLDRHQSEDCRVVNVVADSTYQQRKHESSMKNDAQAKNLERTDGDVRDKKAWKVTGKRGVKRMQKVVLREGEWVDRFGSMQEEAHREDRRKRNNSGDSHSQARDKSGRVQAADFGQRVEGTV